MNWRLFTFLLLADIGLAGNLRGAAALTVTPSTPGNIFLSTAVVEIPVQTTADSVAWTSTDYWGGHASGSAPVQGGKASIRPQLGRVGYFDLHLSARSAAGVEVAQADTAFAVVRPPLTGPRLDSPFGVMTHFAQGWNTDLMPLLARLGLNQIRDEQYWATVEAIRGSYVFPAMYRNYMAAAAANGLRPLVAMTFDNAAYDHLADATATACTPYTDAGCAGFADYGDAILDQYGSQVGALEVWNEYNGTWCTGPAAVDRPTFYAKLLKASYDRLKASRPGVTVLGGAAVLAPLPWFEDLFARGALDSLDALAIHPYRDLPEGVETDLAALNTAMKNANHGVAKPIWATECSSSNDTEPARRASARYLARLMTLMRSAGAARIYWYLGRDYNDFTTGLVHDENSPLGRYAPTATYAAYSNLIAQLEGANPVRRDSITDPRTRVYLFDKGGVETRVAWTVAPPSKLALEAAGPLTVTNLMGETSLVSPVEGNVTIPVDDSPVYITGAVKRVRETGRADWLAADATADFGGVQGGGGWTYGYYEANAGGGYDPAAFKPMTWSRSGYAYQWQSPYGYMAISSDSMHPGTNAGKPVWAVRRWQSYAAGAAQVTASLALAAGGGDGVTAKIFRDGVQIYSAPLGGTSVPTSANIQLNVSLAKGTRLDFALTPGPTANVNFDAAAFRVQITLPLQTVDEWKAARFSPAQLASPAISGDLADPDADGIPNLIECGEGTEPTAPNAAPWVVSVQPDAETGESFLTLAFRRSLAIADLSYDVQAAGSPAGPWLSDPQPAAEAMGDGAGTETVTFRDTVPLSAASRRFLRLCTSR